MIGIVIITHAGLATEFLAAFEHVLGPQEQVATLSIGPEDDNEARRVDLIEAVKRVDRGKGVVILTDMFGGSPSNLAISVMDEVDVEVIAGVNLPMLIRLGQIRKDYPLDEAIQHASSQLTQEAGRKYISVASEFLPRRKRVGS
ncbi:MAG TPA: PTS sugar transporter subunit IIA [Hyphomicrobiaceae bacterium]|nr:PTS sugar transporter subunit IIA [Hyphomicrobiaceae bacterium]